MNGIYISDCLLWLQSQHEGFQCTPYVIGCPFELEKVWAMFRKRVAGGRFEGVGTVVNILRCHWAAVFVSKSERTVEYFDPEGNEPYEKLEDLLGTIAVRVGRELGESAFKVLISEGLHQRGNARCGLYSLVYIWKRLDGSKSFLDFSECRFRIDDEV